MWHRVTLFWPAKATGLLLLSLLFWTGTARAQLGRSYFPAEAANLYEWRSAMVNPSLGAFQTGALEAGFKIFHLGLVPGDKTALKAGYFVLNLPGRLPYRLTVGLQSQFFTMPLLSEMELSFTLSRHFFGLISLGAGIGVRNLSYNTGNFDLVDPDDPVFSGSTSLWQPDISVGATLALSSNFVIGFGIQHLNRPKLALADNTVRLDPVMAFSATYQIRGLSFAMGGNDANAAYNPRAYLQVYDNNWGLFQGGYGENLLWGRGRLHVVGPVSVGYGFTYPLGDLGAISNGNHEAFFVYEFDRVRRIPGLLPPPAGRTNFLPPMARVELVPQFHCYSETDAADVYEFHVKRKIDPDLDPAILQRLSGAELVKLDSTLIRQALQFQAEPLPETPVTLSLREILTPNYLKSLEKIYASTDTIPQGIYVLTDDRDQKRALALANFLKAAFDTTATNLNITVLRREESAFSNLAEDLRMLLKPDESKVLVNPAAIRFRIYPIAVYPNVLQGRLVVENLNNERVFQQEVLTSDTTTIIWDWRTFGGRVIRPGFYRYFMEWKDADGRLRQSPPQTIYVRKLKREIHVTITQKFLEKQIEADKIGIILSK